jgi:membrane associated rhomboid family serine protease
MGGGEPPSWMAHSPLLSLFLTPVTLCMGILLVVIHLLRTKSGGGAVADADADANPDARRQRQRQRRRRPPSPGTDELWATSLDLTWRGGQYWRLVSGALAHGGWIHLALNGSFLYELRAVERAVGSMAYVRLIVVLWLTSAPLHLAMHAALQRATGDARHGAARTVGYSGVLFAFMALSAAAGPSGTVSILGLLQIPAVLSPFANLILASVIVRSASWTGHLAGIIAGYALHFGFPPLIVASNAEALYAIVWTTIAALASLKTHCPERLPWIRCTRPRYEGDSYDDDDRDRYGYGGDDDGDIALVGLGHSRAEALV